MADYDYYKDLMERFKLAQAGLNEEITPPSSIENQNIAEAQFRPEGLSTKGMWAENLDALKNKLSSSDSENSNISPSSVQAAEPYSMLQGVPFTERKPTTANTINIDTTPEPKAVVSNTQPVQTGRGINQDIIPPKDPSKDPTKEPPTALQLLGQAQQAQANTDMASVFSRLGEKIYSDLSGKKADYTVAEGLKGIGETGVTNARQLSDQESKQRQLQKDQERNDPNSAASTRLRALMRQFDPKRTYEGMSYSEMVEASDIAKAIVSKEIAQETTKQKMIEAKASHDNTKHDVNTRVLMSKASEIQKSDNVKAMKAAGDADAVLMDILNTKDDADRAAKIGTGFMLFAKIAQGDNSVVREGDMATLSSKTGLNSDALNKLINRAATGKNITDNDLKNMRVIVQTIKARRAADLKDQLSTFDKQAKALNSPYKSDDLIDVQNLGISNINPSSAYAKEAASNTPSVGTELDAIAAERARRNKK